MSNETHETQAVQFSQGQRCCLVKAQDMSIALKRLEYDCTTVHAVANELGFRAVVTAFATRINKFPRPKVIVYFAGHGSGDEQNPNSTKLYACNAGHVTVQEVCMYADMI